MACGALRLARFNVHSTVEDESSYDFIGLPIPMAAGVIDFFIILFEKVEEPNVLGPWLGENLLENFESFRAAFLVGFLPLLASLMVSNLCYRSHKSFQLSEINPFRILSILAVVLSLIAYWPSLGGFLFFTLYALSGIFEFLMGWKRIKDDGDLFSSK